MRRTRRPGSGYRVPFESSELPVLVGGLAGQYGLKINDFVVLVAAERFRDKQNAAARKRQLLAEEEARIAELVRTMPITSGHSFEGYRIVCYAGYVSGDEVATVPMGVFAGAISNDGVNETIKKVRNVAIQEMKEAAANIDRNAIIGLDFDYFDLDRSGPQGTVEIKIVFTANGTAVEIELL